MPFRCAPHILLSASHRAPQGWMGTAYAGLLTFHLLEVLLLFVSQSIQFPSLHCSHVREERHIRESGVSKVGKQCLYTSYSCLQHPNDSKHTFDFHSRQPYMDEWLRTHALRSYGWIPYRCFLLLLGVLLFASVKLYNIQIKFETSNRLMTRISIN